MSSLFGLYISREGVIIECPLNGQFHDRRDVIITSRMAVSNNFITVTVIQNIQIVSKIYLTGRSRLRRDR